jgi:myo-inositol-1(or 4)-monophosphatase
MDNEINTLLQAMRDAGDAILKLQKTDLSITKKSNNDMLTKADILSNDILKTRLKTSFPHDGWLSEECPDDMHRLSCKRVWVVDPIDGTKEYASGIFEYAISVALVEKGMPILSSVYNPARGELFYAVRGRGAWLNHKKIQCSISTAQPFLLLASRSEYQRGEWKDYQTLHRVKQVGSIAYKLGLIAAGKADATFSLGPKNEWDIAAGVLLVMEAGGMATNKRGEPFIFNRKTVLVDGIVASAAAIHSQIFDLIDKVG